ncbi:hypothetical protein LMG28688_03450 [Paraburkholderia caffeinitolerans]|uniref:Uncharacterized protein n=1 Tax=Paraburkholderia caffeinitolerans TaxID=1723730 RepID=A0A6J5G942_9BURK|nr:hypothetical protein LMG28688_03450 [Paraburkholderia caffeinitolerans]
MRGGCDTRCVLSMGWPPDRSNRTKVLLAHAPAPLRGPEGQTCPDQNAWRIPAATATWVCVDDGESVLIIACDSTEPCGAPCTF